jgi:SAM-dependent methyltransferase
VTPAQAAAQARDGYDQMAQVYADHVTREMSVPSLVRANLDHFAHLVSAVGNGPVADVGCGPGHITDYLAGLGLNMSGVDISSALIDIARASYPDLRFEVGDLARLGIEASTLQAIVSRHSIIHTPPDHLPAVFEEFNRVLAPGGRLFVSFFAAEERGTHGRAFDHAVTAGYELDVDAVVEMLVAVGFSEEVRIVRQARADERQLPHAILFARAQG